MKVNAHTLVLTWKVAMRTEISFHFYIPTVDILTHL